MTKTIYFAHPVWTYDTWTEIAIVAGLEAEGWTVINPNAPEHQAAYLQGGMAYFTGLVAGCDALAWLGEDYRNWDIMGGGSDEVGAGVAREILEAIVHGKPVHYVYQHKDRWQSCPATMPSTILSITETRARRAYHLERMKA